MESFETMVIGLIQASVPDLEQLDGNRGSLSLMHWHLLEALQWVKFDLI